jgi:hypothetical protein
MLRSMEPLISNLHTATPYKVTRFHHLDSIQAPIEKERTQRVVAVEPFHAQILHGAA